MGHFRDQTIMRMISLHAYGECYATGLTGHQLDQKMAFRDQYRPPESISYDFKKLFQ